MKWLLLAALLCACRPVYNPTDPQDVDGGGASDCAAMCSTLEQLGCDKEWGIDPEDGPCLEWCTARESDPKSPTMCPAQVAKATSCNEANQLSQCGD